MARTPGRRGGRARAHADLAFVGPLEPTEPTNTMMMLFQTAVARRARTTAGQARICLDGSDARASCARCACRGGQWFAHVSCLARGRRSRSSVAPGTGGRGGTACCEQEYHRIARSAGRADVEAGGGPASEVCDGAAGIGLCARHEAVGGEAELSMLRRLGASETNILSAQNNLACTYSTIGRLEDAAWIAMFTTG